MNTTPTITKKDLWKVYLSNFTLQASWSYERMQGLGFACAISPVLKKVYGDDREAMAEALTRHMGFFNTCPNYGATVILGIVAALEEKKASGEMITGIKTGMMGPLAGIGDSMMFAIIGPLLFSIPASMALADNIPQALIMLLAVEIVFALFNAVLKWKLICLGYDKGLQLAEGTEDQMQKVTFGAGILGLIVVGALIASIVNISTPLAWKFGEYEFILQDVLNTAFPKILPAVLTAFVFYLVRKKQWSPIKIVLLLFVGFTILGALGIFA